MTRLEKFLLQNAAETIKAETTMSRYFNIGYVTIRLSDHISTKDTYDMQIIIPTNEVTAGLYTVIFGNSGKVLIWNFKQIKEFLPSLILMKEMSTKSLKKPDPKRARSVLQKLELVQKENVEIKPTLNYLGYLQTKLHVKFCGAAERSVLLKPKSSWNSKEIGALVTALHKDLGRSDSINEDFQIFLNHTPVDYNDVLTIYKTIVIDNDKVPTIELLQEAYNYIK